MIRQHRFNFNLWMFVLLCLLFAACENDLKKVQEISAKEVNSLIEQTTGVEVIYSDSAKVKARMLTPLLLHFQVEKPYYEMPKGVKVISFDDSLKKSSTVTSEYAITSKNEKMITLRKNVVATNAKGDVFKSEELIWDQEKQLFYSNKAVSITMANGNIINGTSFESNENFNPWTISQSSGNFKVNGSFQ